MDTTQAIKQLFQIVSKQQDIITKLAQAQGAVPAAPVQSGEVQDQQLTKQLQDVLFGAVPQARSLFVEGGEPQVLSSMDASAKKVVSFKYHMSKNDAALKKAISDAATQVIGPNAFLLQGVGQS